MWRRWKDCTYKYILCEDRTCEAVSEDTIRRVLYEHTFGRPKSELPMGATLDRPSVVTKAAEVNTYAEEDESLDSARP